MDCWNFELPRRGICRSIPRHDRSIDSPEKSSFKREVPMNRSSVLVDQLDEITLIAAAIACAIDFGTDCIDVEDILGVIDVVSPTDEVVAEFRSMDGWTIDEVRQVFFPLMAKFDPRNSL
jgi:hypothetical protein